MAAQTIVVTDTIGPIIRAITWTWTAASDGTVVGAAIQVNGLLIGLTTCPGAVAPTTLYDVTLNSPTIGAIAGFDMLGGKGMNRSAVAQEHVQPVDAVGGTLPVMIPADGTVKLNVTNAGAGGQGITTAFFITGGASRGVA